MTSSQSPVSRSTAEGGGSGRGGLRGRRELVVPLLVALVAGVIALVLLLPGGDDGSSGAGETSVQGTGEDASTREQAVIDALFADLVRRDADDPMALGEVDAPVVMMTWSDFRCPYCGSYARATQNALIATYVETGELRIEWHDFPSLGDASVTAALAGRAAAEQDKFWAFHDAMFAAQAEGTGADVDTAYLLGIAQQVGLDVQKFETDLSSPELRAAVQADLDAGIQLGVNGIPSFLINGEMLAGVAPVDTFVDAIEQALGEAEGAGGDS